MAKKPVAIFDIDGTIFRSSLTIELNNKLIEYGVFPKIVEKEVEEYYENWLDRKGEYEEYLSALVSIFDARIKGRLQYDVKKASEAVIAEQKDRVYRYTRDLVHQLKETHMLVAISGSPMEVVELFATLWDFEVYQGGEYEVDNEGRYTGAVLHNPAKDKKTLLKELRDTHAFEMKGSVGVGDTESDVGFLEEVDRPICFNPNKTLFSIAQEKEWEVVVERKNVIYQFKELFNAQ
jgi:HAD superfamily hydrolase (TIGR01490 family)